MKDLKQYIATTQDKIEKLEQSLRSSRANESYKKALSLGKREAQAKISYLETRL
jgi:predicted RNase H-like nuclease (RuvC/YqgF family)